MNDSDARHVAYSCDKHVWLDAALIKKVRVSSRWCRQQLV